MTEINPKNPAEQLSAYLDGELNDSERDDVEALLREDPSARAELDRLREIAAQVGALPRRPAPSGLAQDVMSSIERDNLLDQPDTLAVHRTSTWRILRSVLLAAAVIALTVTAGLYTVSLMHTPRDQAAFNEIAHAVIPETALPAAQPTSQDRYVLDAVRSMEAIESEAVAPVTNQTPVLVLGGERAAGASAMLDARKVTPLKTEARLEHAFVIAQEDADEAVAAETVESQVILEVATADARDLQWCSEKLNRFLGERKDLSSVTEGIAETLLGLHRAGGITVSPVGLVERHIELPASELPRLVRMFDTGGTVRRDVTLSVGRVLRARGWHQTRQLLAMVGKGDLQPTGMRSAPTGAAATFERPRIASRRGRGQSAPADARRTAFDAEADDELTTFFPKAVKQIWGKLDDGTGDSMITITVRLRAATVAAEPAGPPGRLVPTLSKYPQDP
ncbi:MAG: hypothetical protein V3W34_06000 [Phycisphaerae bacterium]